MSFPERPKISSALGFGFPSKALTSPTVRDPPCLVYVRLSSVEVPTFSVEYYTRSHPCCDGVLLISPFLRQEVTRCTAATRATRTRCGSPATGTHDGSATPQSSARTPSWSCSSSRCMDGWMDGQTGGRGFNSVVRSR